MILFDLADLLLFILNPLLLVLNLFLLISDIFRDRLLKLKEPALISLLSLFHFLLLLAHLNEFCLKSLNPSLLRSNLLSNRFFFLLFLSFKLLLFVVKFFHFHFEVLLDLSLCFFIVFRTGKFLLTFGISLVFLTLQVIDHPS